MRKQSTKLRRKRKKECENREATWSLGRVSEGASTSHKTKMEESRFRIKDTLVEEDSPDFSLGPQF